MGMRINKYVALASSLSRRQADAAIVEGRVAVNGQPLRAGQDVSDGDNVTLDGRTITPAIKTTIMFNKPVNYVCSRDGQGSRTIYELLPAEYQHLQAVGRLDKYSSGLLLLTNDGDMANELTHPSHQKQKVYEVKLDKPLRPLHRQMIQDHGIQLEDGLSKFEVERIDEGNDTKWHIIMREGRNRQIRRTFNASGYEVTGLHRTGFGPYQLNTLALGSCQALGL